MSISNIDRLTSGDALPDLTRLASLPSKPRVFILSDIENEPDDQQSLVRYLLYANELETRGICAVTSAWLPTRTAPESMRTIIKAYGKVVQNLNMHVQPDAQYPTAEALLQLVSTGAPVSDAILTPHEKSFLLTCLPHDLGF